MKREENAKELRVRILLCSSMSVNKRSPPAPHYRGARSYTERSTTCTPRPPRGADARADERPASRSAEIRLACARGVVEEEVLGRELLPPGFPQEKVHFPRALPRGDLVLDLGDGG